MINYLRLSMRLALTLKANLYLLLFMGLIALFGTIHRSHYIILSNFYLYIQYFQQKIFNFNKISRSQIDLKFQN